MKKTRARRINSPIGPLTLRSEDDALTEIVFGNVCDTDDTTTVLVQAQRELEEYFSGTRKVFTTPYRLRGTPFQMRVWTALMEIPYGCTVTYGEIARRIGNEKAGRAVGGANHVNPLPIIVPCHRVIGADGRLTGYAGGMEIKRFLLELER